MASCSSSFSDSNEAKLAKSLTTGAGALSTERHDRASDTEGPGRRHESGQTAAADIVVALDSAQPRTAVSAQPGQGIVGGSVLADPPDKPAKTGWLVYLVMVGFIVAGLVITIIVFGNGEGHSDPLEAFRSSSGSVAVPVPVDTGSGA
mmetsp:Transcript_7662/g.20130  ORF Transcript_7662/g.20130 Transcript_7662/m.20130 type:complete len:148 (+) Transcript_7662:140-583(+)